jgi:hypothetical protein
MKVKTLSQLLLIVFLSAFAAFAQEPKPSPSPSPTPAPAGGLSPVKRALIKEILDQTNTKQSTEAMFNAQFVEMEKQMPDIQWQAISSIDEFKRLTPPQQEEVRLRVKESSSRMIERIRQLFLQRIDIRKVIEDISYDVYDKHFNEDELRGLAEFYRSDLGKKVIGEMPTLFAESMTKASEAIIPKVKGIVDEIEKDQTAEIQKQIDYMIKTAPKAPPKKTTPKKRHP